MLGWKHIVDYCFDDVGLNIIEDFMLYHSVDNLILTILVSLVVTL